VDAIAAIFAGTDVVADLNVESFAAAFAKFQALAAAQLQKRKDALAALRAQGVEPDLYTGSPCLFCLQSYGKVPWHQAAEPELVSIRGRVVN
jgi:hypothetical protein